MEGRGKTPNSAEEVQQPRQKVATEEIEESADDRRRVSGNGDVWEEEITEDQVERRSGRRCDRPVSRRDFVVEYHT